MGINHTIHNAAALFFEVLLQALWGNLNLDWERDKDRGGGMDYLGDIPVTGI